MGYPIISDTIRRTSWPERVGERRSFGILLMVFETGPPNERESLGLRAPTSFLGPRESTTFVGVIVCTFIFSLGGSCRLVVIVGASVA